MASKLKLFNKLGVGRRHKSVDIETPPVLEPPVIEQQHIEDCVEYSLPPDCDEAVYREPADSLNTISSNTSSTHSRTISVREASDSDPNTLPKSVSSADSADSAARQISSGAGAVDSHRLSASLADMIVSPHQAQSMDSQSLHSQPRDGQSHAESSSQCLEQTTAYNCNEDPFTEPTEDASFAVYMNDSQIHAAKLQAARQAPAVPKLNPGADPRNQVLAGASNEYESPWDLASEISEVVKQMQNPTSPLAASTHSLFSQKSNTETSVTSNTLKGRGDSVVGHKVDYGSMKTKSHKIKQPSVHRQSSAGDMRQSKSAVTSTSSPSSASAVLVEGEWREAKPNLSLVSPSSPDLPSPAQILSQPPTNRPGTNTATNFIYDKSNASEIKAMIRYPEEKPKLPCAQPRRSISMSTSPANADDQVYENMKKTKPKEYNDADGVYDDPWNVEQVQQEIFDQLEQRQKQTSKQRRSSEDIPSDRSKKSEIFATPMHMKKRPSDVGSEGTDVAHRRLSASISSTSERLDKLSPRALGGGSIKSTTPPQLPQSTPGQAHANKPVLVVHKTNGALVSSQDRKPVSSTRAGSVRKSKHASSSSSETPECQSRIGLSVNHNLQLTQQPWYHGSIQRFQAEELLRKQPDGSFLIRESTNSPRDKTLSLKNSSGFIHIKIVQQPDGTVILGQFSHPFKNIMEMVEYYSRHKVNIKGAEHTYLEIPVLRDR